MLQIRLNIIRYILHRWWRGTCQGRATMYVSFFPAATLFFSSHCDASTCLPDLPSFLCSGGWQRQSATQNEGGDSKEDNTKTPPLRVFPTNALRLIPPRFAPLSCLLGCSLGYHGTSLPPIVPLLLYHTTGCPFMEDISSTSHVDEPDTSA